MARKKNHLGIKPGPADKLFAKILDWKNPENPSPEELIEWLSETSRIFTSTVRAFDAHNSMIALSDESVRREAGSVVLSSLDYLDRAEVAAELMAGVVGGRVRDAFVEGIRLGLLYERILSHIDGRYGDHWSRQGGRQRGARTTNQAHAELRSQYQPAVDSYMADGETSYTKACEQVATDCGVSSKTVSNHTDNPKPRNKGKWKGRKAL